MNPDEYGPDYQGHLVEQYKLYVEMADRISHRRALANSFFLALQTALVGVSATALARDDDSGNQSGVLILAGLGIVLAYVWLRVLRSYRQLNSAKFAVVHEIEAKLPIAPYKLEWDRLGGGADSEKYTPLTKVEGWVPFVFLVAYVVTAGSAVLTWAR